MKQPDSNNFDMYDVIHELRSPLQTAGGFVDAILDKTISPENYEKYLTIVSSEIKRMSSLINSMLTLCKLENPEEIKMCDLSLSDIIHESAKSLCARKDEKNISVDFEDTDIIIHANPDLIYQMFYNLIENAVKYTDTNGTISIKASVTADGAKKIVIKNSGKGISAEDLPKIFNRFYRADGTDSIPGNGLGLTIVRMIAGFHNGDVTAGSDGATYTEFTVTLE
ncbi:MAG: HAMP domain-containing sensor histidine kinase [Oscillospiraceae bacterium]|nr:HAMP domain-containing sensor histidine kinase [Oscillospiraceae bacterium]